MDHSWVFDRSIPDSALTPRASSSVRTLVEKGRLRPDMTRSACSVATLAGNLAAGCSTSGLPFKVPGRVGDSPIAGHGLFVQPEVGSATATGTGELISGICASFVAVETLRRGGTLLDAVLEVMLRVDELGPLRPHHQVGVIVMDALGNVASGAYRPGFLIATRDEGGR